MSTPAPPIKIGIIGTGIFAKDRHYPAFAALPSLYTVTAVANRTKSKALDFAATIAHLPESQVYTTIDELLNDKQVTAIDALLPSQFMLDAVSAAVAAGKPIAIEKPIAATLAQAREIVAIARETTVPVCVLENFVFHHAIVKIKSVLDQIGEIVYFSHYCSHAFNPSTPYYGTSWRQHPEHVGGFLSDGGVHQVALFTEVLGEVESVSALTTQVRKESGDVDTLVSTLKMKSGIMGTFTYTSAVSAPRINRFMIHGTDGTIIYDNALANATTLSVVKPGGPAEGTLVTVEPDVNNGVTAEFENFAQAVNEKDKSLLKVGVEKGFHHFAVICAAVESGQKGGTKVLVESP
ncbi:uncharacterized protein V1518DRAFT_372221 [Limtongia smithiae]|uniref:uncharacterized protein n=1 Tax=Limtongia smithiae TaxID=1125753 RepID=UPI0034CDCEA8